MGPYKGNLGYREPLPTLDTGFHTWRLEAREKWASAAAAAGAGPGAGAGAGRWWQGSPACPEKHSESLACSTGQR